jgi:hypothetical protein
VIRPAKIGRVNPKDFGLAFPRALKAKKPVAKRGRPEAEIQDAVEAYCDILGLAHFHIPAALLQAGFENGRPKNYAIINAAQAVRGFPDLILFHRETGRYKAIELKTKVGQVTKAQRDWCKLIDAVVCRSFEEAKAEIDGWLA